jgi:hypothetical protein
MAIVAINGKIHSGKDTVAKIWQCLAAGIHSEDVPNFILNPGTSIPVYPDKKFWIKRQFAEKLKRIIALMLNVPVEKLEEEAFKNSLLPDEWQIWECYRGGGVFVSYVDEKDAILWAEQNKDNSYFKYSYKKSERTVRWLLQHIGTDLFRDRLHVNVHVNMLFSEYVPHIEKAHDLKDFSELYTHAACADCHKPFSGWKRQRRCKTCIEKEPRIFPFWILPDLRFKNELEGVKTREGIAFAVERPFAQRFPEFAHLIKPEGHNTVYDIPEEIATDPQYEKFYAKLTHASETSLDGVPLIRVHNNGTLLELVVIYE